MLEPESGILAYKFQVEYAASLTNFKLNMQDWQME